MPAGTRSPTGLAPEAARATAGSATATTELHVKSAPKALVARGITQPPTVAIPGNVQAAPGLAYLEWVELMLKPEHSEEDQRTALLGLSAAECAELLKTNPGLSERSHNVVRERIFMLFPAWSAQVAQV
eukprot:jgi/Tetstr1/462900/TSEL_007848.t1